MLLSVASAEAQTVKLPACGAEIRKTSVSGLSSGAFMTSQLYVAFSEIMVGAGIVAGGPYLCAKSWAGNSLLVNATTTCMHPLTAGSGPNTPLLARYAATLAEYGQIAPLKNLEDDRIYIFSGTRDEIVTTTVVNQTREFFKAVGVPEASIRYDRSIAAGHAFLTDDDTDTACALTRSPYINDCDFSQAGAILEQIYPGLKSPARHRDDSLIAFDQEEFIDSPYTSMDDTAYAYVPTACRSGKSCPVHVVFHGCRQGSHFIGDQYYARTGYNRLAEANDLIMLYPQVRPSSASPLNPDGCWDFWGYSSPDSPTPDYFTRNAPQLRAIHKMIARLAEPRS
ncbi:poly (3-hydroxybutyrate) depolymerase protein [Azotobacter vinelandii CA]|uniref:Poly (3-hydroxybutyrate) depolymerase protein n=2 Tax=Azotobacter vinelandii TaxID=354 RepID=C1DQI4_AZOVD|nr:poly(3-hydroxybutyrate) depolymerase [Azotobacter vinelandii]ACO79620.1 poly (3-hydroxybutyrate) depolymerase protein [Azotobacter vinelandii DJ]AGK14635.1 poly (3-hydroxybutyrate) depolymerase protein [Azotobacter vinelandii CA]AGK21362.1 poly (3-hydroxybutyrate) depolymerase protein [Azotobacter vinelandii CA6]SFX24900.1 hypothetical protein SAMN04244547_00882 [Azotobacter vinelandii]GLK57989.1 depolymerase [Azotobacter vinelandii]